MESLLANPKEQRGRAEIPVFNGKPRL
jgi:hypothetical protein